MRSWAVVLVVLVVLGGGCALPAPLPYTQVLTEALDSYNQQPEVQNIFRLLSANPEPTPVSVVTHGPPKPEEEEDGGAPGGSSPRGDTRCVSPQVIKECSGPVQFQQSSPEIDLSCTDASSNPVLVQRGRFGRFLSRIGRFRPTIHFNLHARGRIRLG
ncbi:CTHL2 protein, partial [Brachypteracias leptosomus]|nr:CTHL2 protein [Brachypteracias leptosomus]